MEIFIGESHKITTDNLNYILLRKKVKSPNQATLVENEKISWAVVGYYGRLSHLIDSLIEKELKNTDSTTFEDLLTKVNEFKKELTIEVINKVALNKGDSFNE